MFTQEEKNAFMTILINKLGDVAEDLVLKVSAKVEEEVEKFIAQLHPETFVPRFFAEIHALAQGYLMGLDKNAAGAALATPFAPAASPVTGK